MASDERETQGPLRSEVDDAIQVANAILDRPGHDPDSGICILARQFLRAREIIRHHEHGE